MIVHPIRPARTARHQSLLYGLLGGVLNAEIAEAFQQCRNQPPALSICGSTCSSLGRRLLAVIPIVLPIEHDGEPVATDPVAQHFATAEFAFVSVGRYVVLNVDERPCVGLANAVPSRGTEKVGELAAWYT